MRDCSNGEVRDRLPELMHDRLSGETLVAVRAHVDECADCRAELALLEQLRSAAVAPPVDMARVVGALPRYRAVPGWRRLLNSGQLRAAAAVLLLVGGYAALRQSRENPATAPVVTAPAVLVSPAPTGQVATTRELAIGDSFHDLTDSDLAAVIEVLGKLEAVTPEAIEEPILPISGGGA